MMTLSETFRALPHIIWTDYLAFIGFLYPAAIWLIYVTWPLVGALSGERGWQGAGGVLFLGISLTVVGLPLIIWRVFVIRRMLQAGREVPGEITSVAFLRDRIVVQLAYTFQSQPYNASTQVHRNARTRQLRTGDEVVLCVDGRNPRRALIRQLYLPQ